MKDWIAAFTTPISFTRLRALVVKESLQVIRDPSTLLIAFVLPPILMFLFANAVSLDVKDVRFGVVLEGDGHGARQLAAAYAATPYFRVTPAHDRRELHPLLVSGQLKGYVVIPVDFDEQLLNPAVAPQIQIITDGSNPNTASFVGGYAQGVLNNWLSYQGSADASPGRIDLQQRFWFNPELDSRRVLLPGAMAIIMTMIGTLLTALVIAREWERGTMEAMMSTPAGILELLISKLTPYFFLGILATLGCTFMAVVIYGVPFRGSLAALLLVTSAFLVPALGQGLLISTLAKNQYLASQVALFTGFMPAFLLSGFLYEIDSMPQWLQFITRLVPARYYVESLQSLFLAGDLWTELLRDIGGLLGVGALFFGLTLAKTHRRIG
jgi:ABC-2 type transport system permease protein